jgi:4-hydroxy-2-oxoheptanedioate aldolase
MTLYRLRAGISGLICIALLVPAAFAADGTRLNRTIETLEAGEPVFGIFTGNFSLANARGLARSGLDFIFIDMEHTPVDGETLQAFLLGMTDKARMLEKGNAQMDVTPLVRIPMSGRENLQWMVKQVLDAGAFGIVFPYVETREEAEIAVRAMRYPQVRGDDAVAPTGLRGASPAIASWFWGSRNYMDQADVWPLDPNGELLAVIQIESKLAVENVEQIAAVPGIGAIFIGPSDLSISYGLPGQLDHPEVAGAMQKVLGVCKARGIPCGLTTNQDTVADYLAEGYTFVTVGYWDDAGISTRPGTALQAGRRAAGRDGD